MNVLIFGGTTEGGRLAETLSKNGFQVTLAVATGYAEDLLPKERSYDVMTGRLDDRAMLRRLRDHPNDVVVDATHPYAEQATRHIVDACEKTGTKYLRLLRPKSERNADLVYVDDMTEAADWLKRKTGNIFLSIGSKELEPFTRIEHYAERCHVRILPMPESLQKTIDLGFRRSNVICMQGPFDEPLNRAMISATNSRFLVTKDSGRTGGVEAKIRAALHCDCRPIVVERPVEESGLSFDELCVHFGIDRKSERNAETSDTFFPLFFDMNGKRVLFVGAGRVARRRIGILKRFSAEMRLIAPEIDEEIDPAGIAWEKREYQRGDVERFDPFLTIAATDRREVNHAVARESQSLGIPVVVSDRRDQCDCYFPAIAENDRLLAGIVSKDGDHRNVRTVAERIRRLFNENNHE